MSEFLEPTLTNLTLTLADTEYSVTLEGSRHFAFQARTSADVRFAFAPGKVAGPVVPFGTLKAGGQFSSPEKLRGTVTIYFATAAAGTVVEIVTWGK